MVVSSFAAFITGLNMMQGMLGFMLLILFAFKAKNPKGYVESVRKYDRMASQWKYVPWGWMLIEGAGGALILLGHPAALPFVASYALYSATQIYFNAIASTEPEMACACSGGALGLKVGWVTFVEFVAILGLSVAVAATL